MTDIKTLIQNGAAIIDVRSPMEFMAGNVPGSKNIPLNEVPDRVAEFQEVEGTIVLCCASGNRSGQACYYLESQGVDCVNGGGWTDVNYVLAQTKA